jgi:hypothetical protein
MEPKRLKSFIVCFISIFVAVIPAFSCGWFELPESYRIALFRAELQKMQGLRPFYYSTNYLNTNIPIPVWNDWTVNCSQWQSELGKDVNTNDIFLILYKTPSNLFLNAYQSNSILEVFAGNTFVASLSKPANKPYLDYLIESKKIEFLNELQQFDSWEDTVKVDSKVDVYSEIIRTFEGNLEKVNNRFLKSRYQFQIVRMNYQMGIYSSCSEAFDKYFKDSAEDVIYGWALLYKALSLDNLGDKNQANYLYSRVFTLSDEKKGRAFRCFNSSPDQLAATLSFAKDNVEKSIILAMSKINYPGKALDLIREISGLSDKNPYFELLVMREINKLEDWLLTPEITNYSPSLYHTYEENQYTAAFKENREKDIAYLQELRSFLISLIESNTAYNHDYLNLAIAHLYFIENQNESGKPYLSKITPAAESGILLQKSIDEIVMIANSENLISESAQIQMAGIFENLEKLAKYNTDIYKNLYSVHSYVSKKYKNINQLALSGLLFMKGQKYKDQFIRETEDYYYEIPEADRYYERIAWFDVNAATKDIDSLIYILQKKDKNLFEKYLCDQPLPDINAFYDLKGTIAFRQNDLETAIQEFSRIPESFWGNNYEFKRFLNEDPFKPLAIDHERNYKYDFSKKHLIQEMIDLKKDIDKNKDHSPALWLKLGHAYYNSSYWGNSWMMKAYFWSCSPFTEYFHIVDDIYGNSNSVLWQKHKDYFDCSLAFDCYKKALETATDDETKAMACFMLHACEHNNYLLDGLRDPYSDKPQKPFTPGYVKLLLSKYESTNTFREINCSSLSNYVN